MPVAGQVADRAGMSVRTVFRLFEDIEDLQAAALRRRLAELSERYGEPTGDTLESRIDALIDRWMPVHEAVTPIRRVVVGMLYRNDRLRALYASGADVLAGRVERIFADDLAAFDEPERSMRLAAVDAAASWETWYRLRSVRGLSVDDATAVVRHAVRSALSR